MSHVNVVVISGRLGTEPEIVSFGDNKKASFRLASTRKFNKEGSLQEETTWVEVSCWGKLGEIIADNLEKGQEVVVKGRLAIEPYEKEGKKLTFTRIIADDIQFGQKAGTGKVSDGISKDDLAKALKSYSSLLSSGISAEVALNAVLGG